MHDINMQADGYQKTGCYNALCPGYVQVHPRFTLGGAFSNISVYDGQQYGVNITINQVINYASLLTFVNINNYSLLH
jgi:hypothetical protein